MKYWFYTLLIGSLLVSYFGVAQKVVKDTDITLVNTYDKYVENQYDYDGRDTILKRFKNELKSALQNKGLKDYFFPKWDERQAIVASKDSMLTILSWDWENNGTYHKYESMYRFAKGNSIYTNFLYEDKGDEEEAKTAIYYKIYQLPDTSYLIKGWGTHGGGKDFFIFRKLSYKDQQLQDCKGCFAGKDYFFFEKSRGDDLEITYYEENKTISYPELAPHLKEGEETGFSVVTGKLNKLIYQDGKFIKLEEN